jgi:DNA repair protein RecN (Recombination protein N)
MLRFLSIRHLAVIDQIEVEFQPGLNVLTGETGAGKSILIEAIALLMGGRASADIVRTGETHATVQAIFDSPDGGELIVRREVSAQGRNRAFIGDALATVGALRSLGSSLLDLHGQHDHERLLDPDQHAGLVDAFAGHEAAVADVGAAHDTWRRAAAALARTQLDEREKRARIEMATFHLEAIDRVAPLENEDGRLDAEQAVLANADHLGQLSREAYAALYDGDHAALAALADVWKRVEGLAALDDRFAEHAARRVEITSQLDDLALMLRDFGNSLDASPDRLQAVEDRRAALERLKRKYGPTLAEVLEQRTQFACELEMLDAGEEEAARLVTDERDARTAFVDMGRSLSAERTSAGRRLALQLADDLKTLAMPEARIEVRVEQMSPEGWTRRGTDRVEFFLSPNPGEQLRPLARIASGGELSRIMLGLRTLAAPDAPGRTLIFDEVDTGIGGAAADAVGARLQQLARTHQVLLITHLAQIAARADSHFQVRKHVRHDRTETHIVRLDTGGREGEIARMIAGAEVTPKVLASARELLARRQEGEENTKHVSHATRQRTRRA